MAQETWVVGDKKPLFTNANGMPLDVVFVFAATPLMTHHLPQALRETQRASDHRNEAHTNTKSAPMINRSDAEPISLTMLVSK